MKNIDSSESRVTWQTSGNKAQFALSRTALDSVVETLHVGRSQAAIIIKPNVAFVKMITSWFGTAKESQMRGIAWVSKIK